MLLTNSSVSHICVVQRNDVTGVSCVEISCSGFIPFGPGYGTECADLMTGGTCTQTCTTGYSDLDNPNGLVHTCEDGHHIFLGTCAVAVAPASGEANRWNKRAGNNGANPPPPIYIRASFR